MYMQSFKETGETIMLKMLVLFGFVLIALSYGYRFLVVDTSYGKLRSSAVQTVVADDGRTTQ